MIALPLGTAAALACSSSPKPAATPDCTQRQGSLAPDFDASKLAGAYTLTLAATSGNDSGQEVTGGLVLKDMPSELRTIPNAPRSPDVFALYGSATLDLEHVGALRLGSIDAEDPLQPGVLGMARSEPSPRLLLRLGTEANRRGVQRFDGGYTALEVTTMEGDAFFGTWRSGVLETRAQGFFCAVPTNAR